MAIATIRKISEIHNLNTKVIDPKNTPKQDLINYDYKEPLLTSTHHQNKNPQVLLQATE